MAETWDYDDGDLSIYTMEEGSPVFLFQPHELCDGDQIPWDEMVAKTRIAAAALDLLAALKAVDMSAVILPYSPTECAVPRATIAKVEAAIAKAEGRS